MKCPHCHSENRDEALFCGDCSKKIQSLTVRQRRLLFTAATCCILALAVYKPISVHFDFLSHLKKSETALANGRTAAALSHCKSALALKPGNAEAESCVAAAMAVNEKENLQAELKYREETTASDGAAAESVVQREASQGKVSPKRKEKDSTEMEIAKSRKNAERRGGKAENCAKGGFCTWYDAMAYCGGRLPTVEQLLSYYKTECAGGRSNPDCKRWYWAHKESGATSAQNVIFTSGSVYENVKGSKTAYARCR